MLSGRHYLKMQPNAKKWPIAVFIVTLKKLPVHYRAYLLSLTGSFTVSWKTDWAAQKDAQCELKLPSLKYPLNATGFSWIMQNKNKSSSSGVPMIETTRKSIIFLHISSARAKVIYFY